MLLAKFFSLIFFTSSVAFAQSNKSDASVSTGKITDGGEFVVKKNIQDVPQVRSMSKNRLKEEIGNVIRRAFNSSTSLGKSVGNVKIGLADKVSGFYQADSGNIASEVDKNDGILQVELSDIQSCFSNVISNLVENRGFFKKASRGDLRDFLSLMDEMVSNLNLQVASFNDLKGLIVKKDAKISIEPNIFDKIKQQFCSSAVELKRLQEKIKTSKCLKKSV
ncbi:MAG: hypothetical protein US22_C0065G0002 [candidate division TM6 bacterium GW2011_GWF2_36_6]|jgi:hypothetical protein|nr:MAG: hypothetical protein US22_C0065G0002 [candidate division TM6 bacterium GW2011_GWF2_36_6]